jgi:hypothetical protein
MYKRASARDVWSENRPIRGAEDYGFGLAGFARAPE